MANPFAENIRSAMHLLADLKILNQAGPQYSLAPSDSFKKASLRAVRYREVYDAAIKNQDFNIMLHDHAFFQFSEIKAGLSIRLAYYPNPYQFIEYKNLKVEALEMLASEAISQDEYDQLLTEAYFTCDIPLIRYDLDLDNHCDMYHPAAHFHIGFHAENRWPARRALSPLAFTLKVLKHYYNDVWREKGEPSGEGENSLDERYREAVRHCNFLPEHYFRPHEAERLFIC